MNLSTLIAAHRKAILAAVGAVIAWATTNYPDGPIHHWLGLVVAVATAAGVLGVPNNRDAVNRIYGAHDIIPRKRAAKPNRTIID